jgi:hypothetical protein
VKAGPTPAFVLARVSAADGVRGWLPMSDCNNVRPFRRGRADCFARIGAIWPRAATWPLLGERDSELRRARASHRGTDLPIERCSWSEDRALAVR